MFKQSLLKKIAKKESVSLTFLEKQLALGEAVIVANKNKKIETPIVVGDGFKIKVNTNIGISPHRPDISSELKKLKIAIAAGTDTVMDLSVGNGCGLARKEVLKHSTVAVGTVPIYEIASFVEQSKRSFEKLNFNDIYTILKAQAKEGVDFFTIHAGVLKKAIDVMKKHKRLCGVVSRGGALIARWMQVNNKENPFYENFDKILELAKEYNITISLGDALRPGAIADSTDKAQVGELAVLGSLVKRCRKYGVQAIVEGPGHVRLDQIAYNMELEKKLCHNAPFYILGPLPTDIAAGYDHITAAIGGAMAGLSGANFLCVVTPAEHLSHPNIADIKDGVIASKIAAHCVDLLRFKDEWNRDYQLSTYRSRRNWEKLFPLCIDEVKARSYRTDNKLNDVCTMCGNFCSMKIAEQCGLLR